MWRRKHKPEVYVPEDLEAKQQEADEALIMAQVGYADALNIEVAAERVMRGHRRIQWENHLGEKMFGVKTA